MMDELTNLLPLDRQKTLRRWYFMREFVVATILVTLLIGTAAILLLPTYVYLTKSADEKQARLIATGNLVSSADQKELTKRLGALTSNAKILAELKDAYGVGHLITDVLAVARLGVILEGFTYAPATTAPKKAAATLAVSGKAATRDALRTYQLALQGLPFIAAAVLPVSAYAQSIDIPFTIALTLKP